MTTSPAPKTIANRIGKKLVKETKRLRSQMWTSDAHVVSHGGLLWLLNRKNRVDRKVICGGYEQEQVSYLFSRMAEGCDCFLDIGANFGLYSVQAAAKNLASAIHAFEPDPRNYAQLQANLYLNNFTTRIQAHPLVLSDSARQVEFEMYPTSSTGQSRVATGAGDAQAVPTTTLPARTLDSTLPMQGKRIFMKIDVEGHESEVLKGAENTLRDNRCFLQIEAWPGHDEALKSHMAAIGYRCVHIINQDHYFEGGSPAAPL